MNDARQRSPAEVAAALRTWLARLPAEWPHTDPATTAFCRHRLRLLADEKILAGKLANDLGARPWRPLGHVLAIVSENDHLGVVAALVAAALTGNRLTLKSRTGLTALLDLRDALGWEQSDCRIATWKSGEQDNAALLADVDGIVMAGGEAMIRHYRQAAAVRVRLIEYGPQLSAAIIAHWPASPAEQMACVDALVRDTTLFLQGVCSSPQFVLIPDAASAQALFAALAARLATLPPLPQEVRLQQALKARELGLLARLGEPTEGAVDPVTGWGVCRTTTDPTGWLPRGFRLVIGDDATLQDAFPPLQTLGVWPAPTGDRQTDALHCCRLGRMHERPVDAPHDGQWELAQWVRFVSCDDA